MAAPVHDQKAAKSYAGLIRGARPGRRRAFALGHMGNFAVITVAKGKPAAAASALKSMSFGPGASPKEASASDYKALTQGFLFLEKKTLVLQCQKKPPAGMLRNMRKYFRFFKVSAPWTGLKLLRLDETDAGDAEDGKVDAAAEEEPAGSDPEDTVTEDPIEDAWEQPASKPANAEEAGAEVTTDDPPSVSAADPRSGPAAAAAHPDPETPAARPPAQDGRDEAHRDPSDTTQRDAHEKVQRLAKQALRMAQLLKLQPGKSEDELNQSLEALLEKAPMERLMLALCYASNVQDLLDAEPVSQPVDRDDHGMATIADAVGALGARIARQRGVMGDAEAVDGRQIESMVRAHWNGRKEAGPAEIIEELTALFGQTFASVEPRRLRALLGLPGKMPPPAEAAGAVEGQQAASEPGPSGSAPQAPLAQAQQLWGKRKSEMAAGIGTLRSELETRFAQNAALPAALTRLQDVLAHLDDGLDLRLDAVLNEPDPQRRAALLPAALATLDRVQEFVSGDEVMAHLDGNEFFPDMELVGPLMGSLVAIRASLA